MSAKQIVRIVALIVVLVAALAPAIPYAGLVVTIVGLVVGWFTSTENRAVLFIIAIALATGLAEALNGIPAIGMYLTAILSTYGDLLAAAAVTVLSVISYERLTES